MKDAEKIEKVQLHNAGLDHLPRLDSSLMEELGKLLRNFDSLSRIRSSEGLQ